MNFHFKEYYSDITSDRQSANINISVISTFFPFRPVTASSVSGGAPFQPPCTHYGAMTHLSLRLIEFSDSRAKICLSSPPREPLMWGGKRFHNPITRFILDQSIISRALQTWVECQVRKGSEWSLDPPTHVVYATFRCQTQIAIDDYYSTMIFLDGWKMENTALQPMFMLKAACGGLRKHEILLLHEICRKEGLIYVKNMYLLLHWFIHGCYSHQGQMVMF